MRFNEYLANFEDEEIMFAVKHSTILNSAEDVFNVGSLTEFEFETIKDLQHEINKGATWDIIVGFMERLTGIKKEELYKKDWTDIFKFKNYVYAQIINICNIEQQTLVGEATDLQIRAGVDKFNVLGVYMQYRTLAGNDITKIAIVKKMKYTDCFLELYCQKLLSDYEKNYIELIRRENSVK